MSPCFRQCTNRSAHRLVGNFDISEQQWKPFSRLIESLQQHTHLPIHDRLVQSSSLHRYSCWSPSRALQTLGESHRHPEAPLQIQARVCPEEVGVGYSQRTPFARDTRRSRVDGVIFRQWRKNEGGLAPAPGPHTPCSRCPLLAIWLAPWRAPFGILGSFT